MHPTRALRRLFILATVGIAAALSTGCAVTPATRAQTAPAALRLEPGQGLLALKVTSNRTMVGTLFAKWNTLRVTHLESKTTTTVFNRSDSSAAHTLFVQPLPAGTYEIDAVGNQASGWLTITETAKAGQALPRFRVEPGALTDLGTLVYVRKHYPVNSSLFRWAQQESPFDRDAVLRQLEPSVARQLGARPAIGWNEGELLTARRAVYDASRALTMRAQSPVRGADGTLYLGESFGQIAARDPSGRWSWLQTPTALPIRAVHVEADGALYAGSDDGILLMRAAGARTWEAITLPVDDASVIHVGPLPGSAQLLVVLQTRDRFIGLTMERGKAAALQEVFSRPRPLFMNPELDAGGAVLASAQRVVVASGSGESKLEVGSPGAAGAAWKFTALDESGSPSGWAVSPGGTLGRFKGIPLTGMYYAASSDGGATWEKRGELNWANGSLLLATDRTGYVVRTDSIPMMDPEKFELSLWRTDDAGATWVKVGKTPAIHGRLLALDGSAQRLGYASTNGRFFVSADGGKSWQLEREVE